MVTIGDRLMPPTLPTKERKVVNRIVVYSHSFYIQEYIPPLVLLLLVLLLT